MVRRNLGLPHRLISKNFNCVIWVKTIDLMHFGWNVWHHYRGNNQRKDVAKFLKIVFSESFKEMEESTIEKLLSSRKEEGLIKIEDNRL